MYNGLLMPHIYNANAVVEASVIDVLKMTPAEGEKMGNALILKCLGDDVSTGGHAHEDA